MPEVAEEKFAKVFYYFHNFIVFGWWASISDRNRFRSVDKEMDFPTKTNTGRELNLCEPRPDAPPVCGCAVVRDGATVDSADTNMYYNGRGWA